MKKALSLILSLVLLLSFAACGKGEADQTTASGASNENKPAAATEIYFLNFKPEVAQVYDEIAKAYKEETGVTLMVETAASGNYEQTLTAKMGTKEAPTLFQINGPKGYANWKDYCADLSGTELYKHLTDK